MKVLVVDDEPEIRKLLSRLIGLEGYEVLQADCLNAASKVILESKPEIVLCDVFLTDGNGINFIIEIKRLNPECEVIMLTAHGNISDGVKAIQNGAFNYLTKGDDNNRIIPMIADAARVCVERKSGKPRQNILEEKQSGFDSITIKSPIMEHLVELAKKVAKTNATVLLTGETGTGKEVFATAIHQESNRKSYPFVAVNCSAFSSELLESEMFGYKAGAFTGAIKDKKGLFQQADKGTIFLDEIGEMPMALQAKLLRALECGEFIPVGSVVHTKVDVRIIAATNRNLKTSIEKGEFREDLYYRLATFTIQLPTLHERKEEIEPLANAFVATFAKRMNIAPPKMEKPFIESLMQYPWKGNVRELRNVVERAVILSENGTLKVEDLPCEFHTVGQDSECMPMADVERNHIQKMLRHTNGNKTEAARLMKIGLTTLYRKLEEYNIIP